MILFILPSFAYLGRSLLRNRKLESGVFSVSRFKNQELRIAIKSKVQGKHCLVLGGTAPPDSELLTLLLLIHTLKKEGAVGVTVLLPYLGYSRHDKKKRGEDLAAEWLGKMLDASGATRAVTLDAHSESDQKLFPIPLISLPVGEIFASFITPSKTVTMAAPDFGAIDNVQAIEQALHVKMNKVYFKKKRTKYGISHLSMHGRPTEEVILVDDILDTVETLIKAAEQLRFAGARNITIMVTHGLFIGTRWRKLWSLGVKRIYCTNSQPRALKFKSKKIIVLPIDDLLKKFYEKFIRR